MASGAFNSGVNAINAQSVDLVGTAVGVMLMQSTFVYNPDNDFVADIVANEVTVAGYSRQTLGTKSWTEDDANNRSYFDGADAVFTALAAGQTVSGAIMFRDTGADATRRLISWNEFSAALATNGGNITVGWDSTGILRYQL